MKLLDAMLPPHVAELLNAAGHGATTPSQLGAPNLPADVLVELVATDRRVIVTENAGDVAAVTACQSSSSASPGGRPSLITTLAHAVDRWSAANAKPGPWPHWLSADLR